jgi:fructokinase
MTYRIGVDLGGTKTEILLLAPDGATVLRRRVGTPAGYAERLTMIAGMVRAVEAEIGTEATVGVGIPGTISPATGKVQNANSNILNGHEFDRDLGELLGREVRVANDANCFALSEAVDGAAAGANTVFGVILGTGCGAGIVVHGRLLEGRHRIAGEFGHTPLPWPRAEEMPLRPCWCGRAGCLETYLAGPALAFECDGVGARDATGVADRAAAGDERARNALRLHADRLARGLAMITNILDPDAIVLGGGLSNLPGLAESLPGLMKPYIFADHFAPNVVRHRHGDSSGVRGAAWLWPGKEAAF